MKRNLFLSGPAFCGKSGLIRQQLGARLQWAGGFCTELSASEDGAFGCRMMPAAMAGGVEGYEKKKEEISIDELLDKVEELVGKGEKVKKAVSEVSSEYDYSKNLLYNAYIRQKESKS